MIAYYLLKYKNTAFVYFISLLCFATIFAQKADSQEFSRIEATAGFNIKESTRGVAVADFDGDLDLDVYIVVEQTYDPSDARTWSKLYRNNNDATFTDVTKESHLNEGNSTLFTKRGASWGDFNNDGWPDLLLTYQSGVQLYQNLGDGTFKDITSSAQIGFTVGCEIKTGMWWDYNNDGLSDIYISGFSGCTDNKVYKNLGNGTFENVTLPLGLNISNLSYMSISIDVNQDGFTDVLSSVDFGENQLFVSNGGTSFTERAAEYHLNSGGNNMGLSTGDYNNDGLFDIFCTDIKLNSLFTANKNRTFTDKAMEYGMLNTDWAWQSRFADFDNDGDEDLYVVNGYEGVAYQNKLFENQWIEKGEGFTDASESSGLGIFSVSECVESFDYDNDGDMDLLVTSDKAGSSPVFFNNKTIEQTIPSGKRWLKVSLEGKKSNRNGFGARLEIRYGGKKQFRLYHGVGLYSQSVQPVQFGVGATAVIDTLLVNWPSGEIDTITALPTNTYLQIREKSGYKLIEAASHKVYGCTDVNSCSFNPKATIDDGISCTYLAAGEITGPTESNMFKTETYSYTAPEGNELAWSVENGQIVEGYGGSTIKVQWGIAQEGKVSVHEKGACYGQKASLLVKISLDQSFTQHSVARIWIEALLAAIRGDYARPTIHARNLFHTSVAMYDAWAIYDKNSKPYLLGNRVGNFESSFKGFQTNEEKVSARNKTISYAAYRLLKHRFASSPSVKESTKRFDEIMNQLGYDTSFSSTDYSKGNAAAMGNYIAQTVIDYGLQDGSREATNYDNAFYQPVNPPLEPAKPGNTTLVDPNRWQPLALKTFIDQSGHLIEGSTPKSLSPEWGAVTPFSMTGEDATPRGKLTVYEDPGAPPYLNSADNGADYKWSFSMVSIWGSHLDPSDGVIWDISPGSIGNIDPLSFPGKFSEYGNFFHYFDGGDIGKGRKVNPVTGQPYEVQLVPRGDYTRVLAEFWADGPNSEAPPGHWFTILNYVSDHPLFEKKFEGKGEILDALEWDVKSYFTLGGTMQDAAIAAWSIKGYYDYIRPVSAIRYLAELGQSSDKTLKNYHQYGIPLVKGYIEVVEPGDSLAGMNGENVGKIKLYTWKGHSYIKDPAVDQAGVGWILAANWWPYQRPSFVTPPFAGYISGHSTYSRAAAEVMTKITGNEYFPGGYGEFIAQKNKFLVFEQGPSVDVKLRWATYRDASDQCSLSRIWGGIHPPCDDIPGRIIGEKIGKNAVDFAKTYFVSPTESSKKMAFQPQIYPNPVGRGERLRISHTRNNQLFQLIDLQGKIVQLQGSYTSDQQQTTTLSIGNVSPGLYLLRSEGSAWKVLVK